MQKDVSTSESCSMSNLRLLSDITRVVDKKPVTYGKKYEVVMLISEHDNVLIVEGKERFSVLKELTEEVK